MERSGHNSVESLYTYQIVNNMQYEEIVSDISKEQEMIRWCCQGKATMSLQRKEFVKKKPKRGTGIQTDTFNFTNCSFVFNITK